MNWVLSMTYLWLKAGHIIFVIFWMAGLFMLPRYFIYHQEAELGSEESSRWLEREARLLKIILWPSMVIVWLLGLVLAYSTGAFAQGWFHVKLAAVLGHELGHVSAQHAQRQEQAEALSGIAAALVGAAVVPLASRVARAWAATPAPWCSTSSPALSPSRT